MASRKQYVLGDFVRFAEGRFPSDYKAIADLNAYKFKRKIFIDANGRAQRAEMLLVGHYARRSGGPSVWALATGYCVRYYRGETTKVAPLTQDIHTSKIYYDPPLKYMGGYKASSDPRPNGMSPARRVERDVVEAAIHFLFLLSNRLETTFNLPNPKLLSNFRTACRNYA
ncbi:hypothetical protein C7974DRAFT_272392, partial [Boeremia exigua]|uniref:uncharacterized protein n=1 Tax=Boeremia exigua TaxID=749465 RepID=UPI001E8DCDA8